MSIRNALPTLIGRTEATATADPAAGADASISPPDNQRSLLVALSFTLACDANVANRVVLLKHKIATAEFVIAAGVGAMGASSITTNVVGPGLTSIATVTGTNNSTSCAIDNMFEGNHTLELEIVNIQVGDQISDILCLWNAWQSETF